jgi:hypothetical protein
VAGSTLGRNRSVDGRIAAFACGSLALLVLAGCATAGVPGSPGASASRAESANQMAMPSDAKPMGGPGGTEASAASANRTAPEVPAAEAMPRRIIYTAEVNLVAEDLSKAEQALRRLVKEHRGYLAEDEVAGSPGQPRSGHWKVRVPVDRFDAFMAQAQKLGELQRVHTDSQDVSEEFYDLKARLANKQVEERRLLDHLRGSTAKLTDILAVERELSRVRGEVEQLQGRIRYLASQTDFSTVTVSITEVREYLPVERTSFVSQIGRTFHESWRILVLAGQSIVLLAVALAPWLVVAAVLALLAVPAVRAARRRLGTAPASGTPPPGR